MIVVLGHSEVTLHREREDASLCPSVYCVFVIYILTVSEQYVTGFPGLPHFHQALLLSYFLIFLTSESSNCVNFPSLMFSWSLMIFVIGSCVTFWGFPSKFSKCCFHRCIRSAWLVASGLVFAVFFLLLTSFIVFHAILNCLSSTESLILLISFCVYLLN